MFIQQIFVVRHWAESSIESPKKDTVVDLMEFLFLRGNNRN